MDSEDGLDLSDSDDDRTFKPIFNDSSDTDNDDTMTKIKTKPKTKHLLRHLSKKYVPYPLLY